MRVLYFAESVRDVLRIMSGFCEKIGDGEDTDARGAKEEREQTVKIGKRQGRV
jgi:hypothetical protein